MKKYIKPRTAQNNRDDIRLKFQYETIRLFLIANELIHIASNLVQFTLFL